MNTELLRVLSTLPGIILGFTIHEYTHAYMADRLGDPTPRRQGRLTLDPRKHIDPIGFILIIIVGFGWAKPVEINHSYLKNPKKDDMMISIAGPISNFILACFFVLLIKIFTPAITPRSLSLFTILYYSAYINCILFIFNLLPIHPLDGFHILSNLVSLKHYSTLEKIKRYSTIILILLIVTGITSYIVGWPANKTLDFITRLFNV